MAYVYRFKNSQDEVIYVGFTGQTLDARIGQHFSDKGHLCKECYRSVAKIEYKKYKTKCDAIVMETYYINYFKSRYNKQNKKNDTLTINIDDAQNWKLFREIKPIKSLKSESTGFIWKTIAFIYVVAMVMKLIGLI